MTREEKFAALKATALSYLRGDRIQYDQLSMDRLLRVTPRRRYLLPPEAATAQHRLFLDCATFVAGVYWNTFGYLLEADVTWFMRELVRERVFYAAFSHPEPAERIDALQRELRQTLRPGDAVVCSRETNGHIMLYLDETHFIHCTAKVCGGSYDYENRREQITEIGGIHLDDPHDWFTPGKKRYLFGDEVRYLAVLRPLDRVGDPTPDALARLGEARGLDCEVLTAPFGAQTAQPGERVTYTVAVKNLRETPARVAVRFGDRTAQMTLAPQERGEAPFSVTAPDAPFLTPPEIAVNGLRVYAPRVYVGKNLTSTQRAALCAAAPCGGAWETFRRAYAAAGIALPADEQQLWNHRFYRHDAIEGINVLSRRAQQPARDMAVYAMFGGVGVITPNVAADCYLRTDQLRADWLQTGDLLLVSDDHTFRKTYGCMCTGDTMLGAPEHGESVRTLAAEEATRWLDSLPGRYAYLVLRPSLAV